MAGGDSPSHTVPGGVGGCLLTLFWKPVLRVGLMPPGARWGGTGRPPAPRRGALLLDGGPLPARPQPAPPPPGGTFCLLVGVRIRVRTLLGPRDPSRTPRGRRRPFPPVSLLPRPLEGTAHGYAHSTVAAAERGRQGLQRSAARGRGGPSSSSANLAGRLSAAANRGASPAAVAQATPSCWLPRAAPRARADLGPLAAGAGRRRARRAGLFAVLFALGSPGAGQLLGAPHRGLTAFCSQDRAPTCGSSAHSPASSRLFLPPPRTALPSAAC